MNKNSLALVCAAALFVSCSKPRASNNTNTDDAKLRPEVAAAHGGASPSPRDESSATPTP